MYHLNSHAFEAKRHTQVITLGLVRLKEISDENSPVVSLALGFPATRPVKNALLLLKPPRL